MIRIIIVDDEILSRVGIQSFFDEEADVEVVGTFGMASEAIEFLRKNKVDIVITDIEMADINGLEFIQIIREEDLANGVIIVSCHSDFSYAQEAIAKGTNSYVLKHNISKQSLLEEVKRVYAATLRQSSTSDHKTLFSKDKSIPEDCIYRLAIIKICPSDSTVEVRNIEKPMLVHLLEGIVNRYHIGTLFAPYGKEIFVVFQLDKTRNLKNREQQLLEYVQIIERNMLQYINEKILFGISEEFSKLEDISLHYEEAVQAVGNSFYCPDNNLFFYNFRKKEFSIPHFSWRSFLDPDGLKIVSSELRDALAISREEQWDVSQLKSQIIQNISILLYKVSTEYMVGKQFESEWNSLKTMPLLITSSNTVEQLETNTLHILSLLWGECSKEMVYDELSGAFRYIEQHIKEKISLDELTATCHMSAPTFCKKFKDRTGKTPFEYINECRVEKAKTMMKNRKYSLWEISEATGFTNTNYMIRVFKKYTGQTVSEYRNQLGFPEGDVLL